jgi:rhodanese-related sulfurtransferase
MVNRLDRPLLIRAAALVVAGAAAGLGVNAARPAGAIALLRFEPPTSCSAEEPAVAPVAELTPGEASQLCGRGGVVFADTRSGERFEAGHAAGAVHLPCDATELGAQAAIASLERAGAQTVIVYGDSSDDGRAVAETLRRRGLRTDLRVLRGGFAAWEREGLACVSGPFEGSTVAGKTEPSP